MRKHILLTQLLLFITISTLAQSSRLQVVAMPGDGMYTLLRRHGLNPADHLSNFLEINKDNFGRNNGLIAGRKYLIPQLTDTPESREATPASEPTPATAVERSSPELIEVPLFGEKYARLEVKDQKLQGAVYYLSSGHGGPDPGAVGKYGSNQLAEDEYAYDVTIRLARVLMEHGATVYMIVQDPDDGIRDNGVLKMDRDETAYLNKKIPLNHSARLRQRTDAVNQLHQKHKGDYQRMLAIHVDSRSESQNIDVFFYHHENSPLGEQLAKSIHQTFTSKYKRYQPNRDYSGNVSQRNSLFVIKYSNPPTVFIELGNIRNSRDQRRFVIADNRQALANWIYEGLLADYKSK